MLTILKTLWALSLVVFSGTFVFGQDYTIRQGTSDDSKQIYFNLVDATDGYTPEPDLTVTCTIQKPLTTTYISCLGSTTSVGNGSYRLILDEREIQDIGVGSIYLTAAGARQKHIHFTTVPNGSMFSGASSSIAPHSNFNNTSYWGKTGVTVIEDSTADYLGFTIADTITGDGANSEHRVSYANLKPEGSGYTYITAEVKGGTLANAWIGDRSWGAGVNINTTTGVLTPSTTTLLRGWKVDRLTSSWWRVHILYSPNPTDVSSNNMVVALGNGTAGTGPPIFTTSGTMLFARAHIMRAEDVSPLLLAEILPNLQGASSTSSVTLSASESVSPNFYNNREICMRFGYISSAFVKQQKTCSCIMAYNGVTKVATISPVTSFILDNTFKYEIGGVCLNNISSVSGVTTAVTVGTINTGVITDTSITQAAADKIGASVPRNINMGR